MAGYALSAYPALVFRTKRGDWEVKVFPLYWFGIEVALGVILQAAWWVSRLKF